MGQRPGGNNVNIVGPPSRYKSIWYLGSHIGECQYSNGLGWWRWKSEQQETMQHWEAGSKGQVLDKR